MDPDDIQQETVPLSTEAASVSRRPSLIQQVSTFLGLDEDENEEEKRKWDRKRLRRMVSSQRRNIDTNEATKFVKNHLADSTDSSVFVSPETPGSDNSHSLGQISPGKIGRTNLDQSKSVDSTISQRRTSNLDRKSLRKESIPSAVLDSISTFIRKGSFIDKKKLRLQASFASKRSFDMDSILFDTPEEEEQPKDEEDVQLGVDMESPSGIVFDIPSSASESFEMTTLASHRRKMKPLKIPEIPEETSFEMEVAEKSSSDEGQVDPLAFPRMTAKVLRKKSSVRRRVETPPERPSDLASGSELIVAEVLDAVEQAVLVADDAEERKSKRPVLFRQKSVADDLFYDLDAPQVDAYHPDIAASPPHESGEFPHPRFVTHIDIGDAATISRSQPTTLGTIVAPRIETRPDRPSTLQIRVGTRDMQAQARRKRAALLRGAQKVGVIKSNKRKRGIGWIGEFFDRDYKPLPKEVVAFIDDEQEETPWFTCYVTIIQIVIFITSILTYGIGPWNYGQVEYSESVQDITLTLRRVSYQEPGNPWLGPSYSSLIHLGAKYSPCMRAERQLIAAIDEDRRVENTTGCCVSNEGSCYQSTRSLCPEGYARWNRFDDKIGKRKNGMVLRKSKSDGDLLSMGRKKNEIVEKTTGAVCGQDPDYCDFPSSTGAQKWSNDMTKWPICWKKHNGSGQPDWMTCQVTGRPCCIQLQGLCRIATKEYCDFVHGYYHEEATLCSQVNCFDDVCGMIPRFSSSPDQFSRLILPIFLHAGVFHLLFTVVFQIKIMADMEKLLGWKRMALVYMCSGMGGNLASAIFMPFHPEVGPSGSQCGVFAAVIFDTYTHRHLLKDMSSVVIINMIICFCLFCFGLFPWIDNWSHIFGFTFGFLVTIVTFPYIDFPDYEEKKVWKIQPSSSPLGQMPRSSIVIQNEPNSGFFNCWETFKKLDKSKKRLFSKMAAFIVAISLFVILFICFVSNFEINSPWLMYLNCIPFLEGCQNQGLTLKKWLPI